jgi:ribose 5-phosphate isomerase B
MIMGMKIYVASDHAGFKYKAYLIHALKTLNFGEIVDLGTKTEDSVDYPDFAKILSKHVLEDAASGKPHSNIDASGKYTAKLQTCGILICGSGQGMAMTANKIEGIRAALCWDLPSAILSRQHNNANVLCLGARLIPEGLGFLIAQAWLQTEFLGGRHERRTDKITAC